MIEQMEHEERRFLVCDHCGTCCLLAGPAARSIAAHPPRCSGCEGPMRITSQAVPLRRVS